MQSVWVAVLLGAALGGAVWLLISGIRGTLVDPTRPPSRTARVGAALRSPVLSGRIVGGIAVAALALAVTRWPVAALGLGALVLWWPALFGGTTSEQRQIASLEALVTWTETLRDTIAAHASLEQAIPSSAVNAPVLIRPALIALVGQLRARVPMDKALLALAAELDDPSADLVIAALMLSATRRGDRLGEVLTGLTTTAREELEMRRKISAGRAELRRGMQIVVGVTVAIGVFLVVFSGAYIAPYGTPAGQVALAAVVGIFAAAFLWMRRLSAQQPVAPFLSRPGQQSDPAEARLVASVTDQYPPATTVVIHMIAAIGLGALVGAVLFMLVIQVARPHPAPLVQLARFDAAHDPGAAAGRPPLAGPTASRSQGLPARVGAWVALQLTRRGVTHTSLRQDLAVTGRTYEQAMTRKVSFAGGGLLASLMLLVAVPAAVGAALPTGAPLVLSVVLAAGLFFLPDLEARAEAAHRRAEFRHALGAYLDLVALEMAARAAPAEALPAAAKVGVGWPLALIRVTLYRATRAGLDPWAALGELGRRIGVTELRDLGQLIALVAHDGARVRSTLTARANTMRRHELANLAGEAGKADQSMQMAQVLIGLGYLLFIGYPAMVAVLSF